MKLSLRYLFGILFVLATRTLSATNSDSVNVLHYNIHIDTLSSVTDTLAAHTEVILKPLYNSMDRFTLDLLELNVDSIKVNGAVASWNYNDTLLVVLSPSAYNTTDSVRIMVWYNGVPQTDGSGWGGFYLNNSLYAYNLGVGFDADPHTYGRVWFPCKDNFQDKATFDMYVETIPSQMAVCNGTLQGQVTGTDGNIVWHWNLKDRISTYLASVAVSDYVAVTDTLFSIDGDTIPIAIYVRPTDSVDAVGSFSTLQAVLQGFEANFGPYPFERVGFVAVPFNSGAMEHATNIAYPVATIDGSLNYQTLWGHELSHMWFGDLVTCTEAEEMWLNEGYASWCESVMLEILNGTTAYKNSVRSNHSEVLRKAHIDDASYLAVSGISHAYTYGTTVYDKGASVAHTLRKYIGDSLFFPAIKYYLGVSSFRNANSDSLAHKLETSSGVALAEFFDGWVYAPGFPHFSIDSVIVFGSGPFDVKVYMRQRSRGPAPLINDNRIWITFMDAGLNTNTQLLTFSGAGGSTTFSVPFAPYAVMADIEEFNADATIDNYQFINSTGIKTFPNTYFEADVTAAPDSSFLRITHNWVAPDSFITPHPGMSLNTVRYWTVEGVFSPSFITKGKFSYNGTASQYLDAGWFINSEDSVLLFYRRSAGNDWELVPNFTRNTGGSLTDRIGSISVDTLVPGEYALGINGFVLNTSGPAPALQFNLYPNPVDAELFLAFPKAEGYNVRIYDLSGKVISQFKIADGQAEHILNVGEWTSGVYLVEVKGRKGRTVTRRFVVE
jgi:Peptidase family M1 domain/Secretion system C-terminal sorting domain/Peptidase M1 N-terminal domain